MCRKTNLPWRTLPASKVMPRVPEKMFPCIVLSAARKADLPALQKTLLDLAPPFKMTFLPAAIEKVLGVLKMKMASETKPLSPRPASRMRSPVETGKGERDVRSSVSFTIPLHASSHTQRAWQHRFGM